MAIYFQNTLARTSDFLKISDRYSSVQSVYRAKREGRLKLKLVGGLQFVQINTEQLSRIFSIASWKGLMSITEEQLPSSLSTVGQISKKVGVGEAVILEWALFNRLDAYWVGGTFFVNPALAKQVAAAG